jgi:hypothetical protein
MPEEPKTHLVLTLDSAEGSDPREVTDLTAQLRRRLLELDVEKVEPVRSSDVPAGAKSAEAAAIGALAVTLSPAVISGVIGLVQSWITNRPAQSATLTIGEDSIVVTHASDADKERLMQLFVERHAKEQPGDER